MSNFTRASIFLIFSCFFIFSLRLRAQDSLSLSGAIQTGLANNFDIQIEKLNVEIAENNNTWGAAGRYPTIIFSISQNNNFRDVVNPASFLQGLTISNDIGPSISVNWILFNGFSVSISRERLQKLQELSMGNAQVVVENAIQAIILAYYTTILEAEQLSVLEKVFTLSKDRYEYVKLKGELGSAVTFDILQEQNAYLTDSSNYVTQEVNFRNARRNLNLLMGVDIDTEYGLTNDLDVQTQEYGLEDLYDKMIASNSNLQNQFLNLQILQTETRLAKTELYPQLSLNLGGSYNWARQDLSQADLAFSDPDNPRPPVSQTRTGNYAAGFTLSYLLFDGGRVKRTIENAYTQERVGQLQIDQLKLSLKNELIASYDLYNVRKKLLNISQQNVESGELNLQLAEERYKNGTINSFDYRDIQINYLNAALSNLQAKYNLIDAETELLRLTGGIVQEYENIN